jgi:hypothetical protein
MDKETIIVPMDNQTLQWLKECIDTAPNEDSLNGILVTLEWFYSIDKDFGSFSVLVELINKKLKI